jgi:hypothetical protein
MPAVASRALRALALKCDSRDAGFDRTSATAVMSAYRQERLLLPLNTHETGYIAAPQHDVGCLGLDRSAPGDRQGVDGASPSR